MTVNFKVDEASVREFFDNLDSETLLMNINRMLKSNKILVLSTNNLIGNRVLIKND